MIFYLGQTVLIDRGDKSQLGIYIGTDEELLDSNKCFVFSTYSNDNTDGDAFVEDIKNLSYVYRQSDVLDKEIYHGPFCTYRLGGCLTDAYIKKWIDAMISEVNAIVSEKDFYLF